MLTIALLLALILSSLSAGRLISFADSGVREYQVGDDVWAYLYPGGLLRLEGQGDTWDYAGDEANRAPFYAERDDIASLEIEAGITHVGDYLFYNCAALTGELELPATLVRLGEGAFSGESYSDAPKFSYVDNRFTQQDVVVRETVPLSHPEEQSDEGSFLDETEEEGQEQDSSAAPQNDMVEPAPLSHPEEQSDEGSFPDEPEQQGEEQDSSPPAQPAETAGIVAGDAGSLSLEIEDFGLSAKNDNTPSPSLSIQTLTQQEIGAEAFYPGQCGVYACSEENASFAQAAEEAGWQRIVGWRDMLFSDGLGGESVSAALPQTASGLFLPSYEESGLPRPDGSLSRYLFLGWSPTPLGHPEEQGDEGSFLDETEQQEQEQGQEQDSSPPAQNDTGGAAKNDTGGAASPVILSDSEGSFLPPHSFYTGPAASLMAQWRVDDRVMEYQTISAQAEDLLVSVSGDLPVGAEVSAEMVAIETAQAALDESLGAEHGQTVLYALDISLLVEGEKYQPADYGESVTVNIANIRAEEAAPLSVYHLPEDSGGPAPAEKIAVESATTDAVAFMAESFSVFAITIDNATYNVTFDDGEYDIECSVNGTDFAPLVDNAAATSTGTLYFKVTPHAGYMADHLSVSAGATLAGPVDGVYTLSNFTGNVDVTIPCLGITGIPRANGALSAVTSDMGNNLSYQWQSCATVNGADWNSIGANDSYTVTATDATAGLYIRVVVTDNTNSKTYTSKPIGPAGVYIDLDIANGSIIINGNGNGGGTYTQGQQINVPYSSSDFFRITGTAGVKNESGTYNIALTGAGPFNIILHDLTIYTGIRLNTENDTDGGPAPLSTNGVTGNEPVNIYLSGNNILQNNATNGASSSTYAALEKNKSDTHSFALVIDSWNKSHDHTGGECTAAQCGQLTARGGADSAGIGGSDRIHGDTNNITIKGGVIIANTQRSHGAGIGAGNNKEATGIRIEGGNITATGVENGAGIGGSGGGNGDGKKGTVTISGGKIEARSNLNGAGIGGGGSNTGLGGAGDVTISGGTISAGSIGGGNSGNNNGGRADITISGGMVNANSLGGGNTNNKYESSTVTASTGGDATVTISGGTVVAGSIGGGYSVSNGYKDATVFISGGSLNARIAGAPRNGTTLAPGAEVYLTRGILYYLDNAQAGKKLTGLNVTNAEYGFNDIHTDADGMVYLWLPDGSTVSEAVSEGRNYVGSVGVKDIGVLLNDCAKPYYALNVACGNFYTLYNQPEGGTEFRGARTVPAGTVVDGYLQAKKYDGVHYYAVTAYISKIVQTPQGAQSVMEEMEPYQGPDSSTNVGQGKYHYRIQVNTDTEMFFICADGEGNTTVLDIAGADVVISEAENTEHDEYFPNVSLKVVRKGYILDPYNGKFLLTSDGISTSNTVTLRSGAAKVIVDQLTASRADSLIRAEGGEMELHYQVGFNNIISCTGSGSPIQVSPGATLKIVADSGGSLTLNGGAGQPAIGGGGAVEIEKSAGFLQLNSGAGAASQVRAAEYSYTANIGSPVYTLALSQGELIGYQNSEGQLVANALAGGTLYKSCGISYSLSTGVSQPSDKGISGGNYQATLAGADIIRVTRDGAEVPAAEGGEINYTWDSANDKLTIMGRAAYGNLVVNAAPNNAILYTAADYTGTYDEDEHGISLTVHTPVSGCQIYYSETELNANNYNTSGSTAEIKKRNFTNGPKRIYWYIHYTGSGYNDVAGSNTITIEPGQNVWLVGLTCASVPYNTPLAFNAKAKWGTEQYSFTTEAGVTVGGEPTEPGVYYITATVPADPEGNYPALTSAALRFSIENTKVYLRAGRALANLLSDADLANPARSINVPANGTATVLYRFQYYPSPNTLLGLRFTPALPEGTKITFMDVSEKITNVLNTPIYMYNVVGENGCAYISTAQILVMGSAGAARDSGIYNAFLMSQQVFNSAYQFSIDFPEDRALPQEDTVITLLRGEEEVANASVTLHFDSPVNRVVSGDGVTANDPASAGANSISVPLTVNASGPEDEHKVLAVTLQAKDAQGNPTYLVTEGYSVSLSGGNLSGSMSPTHQHGNFFIFDLGQADITGEAYTVAFTNLMPGEYSVQADICVVPEAERNYPCHGKQGASVTAGNLVVNAAAYWLNVVSMTSDNPVNDNHRLVAAGTETELTFSLYYSINDPGNQGSVSLTAVSQSQDTPVTSPPAYTDLSTPWLVANLPYNIPLVGGAAIGTKTDVVVTVPASTSPGTYRVKFVMNTAEVNYNIIVQ